MYVISRCEWLVIMEVINQVTTAYTTNFNPVFTCVCVYSAAPLYYCVCVRDLNCSHTSFISVTMLSSNF